MHIYHGKIKIKYMRLQILQLLMVALYLKNKNPIAYKNNYYNINDVL